MGAKSKVNSTDHSMVSVGGSGRARMVHDGGGKENCSVAFVSKEVGRREDLLELGGGWGATAPWSEALLVDLDCGWN
jgi:hypothetical protein